MPRKARIDAPGALHHLIMRGIERRKIFQDDQDRDQFLDRLRNILTETATPCYAWALLPNHVHLLLRTGTVPISTVMRRLLTGYAVTYNRRHQRHGQLFQNRYKSILCQEDPYLLELVRYIHLNPLRAKVVSDLNALDDYAYTGHCVLMGRRENSWQDAGTILGRYDQRKVVARRRYRAYVKEGIVQGRRAELVRGGLMRGVRGWVEAKEIRRGSERVKGDERILGESRFIEEVLRVSEEQMERRCRLRVRGYDLEKLAKRVGRVLGIEPKQIWSQGRYSDLVRARSLFCHWAVREMGVSATELGRRLGLTQPAVSISVQRGERIAREKGLKLLEE
jgi:putative transposase